MRRLATLHPLTTYFGLAFTIAWLGWIPIALLKHGATGDAGNPVILLAPFAAGPLFAALIVTGLTGGKHAVKLLAKRLIQWRTGFRWYLFALLSPGAILLAGVGLKALITGTAPDFSTTVANTDFATISPWVLFPIALISGLFAGPLNEELGWRGFALPHLQARFSPFTATLILGLLWGLWHLPLFFIPGMIQAQLPIAAFMISVMLNSFFYTWLYNRTGGSVLLAVLLHGAFNTSTAFVPLFVTEVPVLIATGLAVMLLLLVTRRQWVAAPGSSPARISA